MKAAVLGRAVLENDVLGTFDQMSRDVHGAFPPADLEDDEVQHPTWNLGAACFAVLGFADEKNATGGPV